MAQAKQQEARPLGWNAYTEQLARTRAKELHDDFLKAVAQVLAICVEEDIKDPGRAFVFHSAMYLINRKWDWPEYNKSKEFKKVVKHYKARLDIINS